MTSPSISNHAPPWILATLLSFSPFVLSFSPLENRLNTPKLSVAAKRGVQKEGDVNEAVEQLQCCRLFFHKIGNLNAAFDPVFKYTNVVGKAFNKIFNFKSTGEGTVRGIRIICPR